MHTVKHTKQSLSDLSDLLWYEADRSVGQRALVLAYEAGRMSMLAQAAPEEDYGWAVLDPVNVDWAVQAAEQWIPRPECPDCAYGSHAKGDDGYCVCCSAAL